MRAVHLVIGTLLSPSWLHAFLHSDPSARSQCNKVQVPASMLDPPQQKGILGDPLSLRFTKYGPGHFSLVGKKICTSRLSSFGNASKVHFDRPVTGSVSRSILLRVATSSIFGFILQPLAARATTRDPKTGIRLPDVGEIEASIPVDWSDVENPVSSSDPKLLFARLDKQPDSLFYKDPRFVEHVDENAVQLLTDYISKTAIQPGDRSILDLCSSWTSHIDPSVARKLSRISGLGMNTQELESNSVLTDWTVQDLNENPRLTKYHDESFDVVLCQLSIDYLTKPLEVLQEVGRVLKPGGRIHILFSNRLFLTKAVGMWTGGDDIDHAYYVGCYLHFCKGGFEDIKARDLSTRRGGRDNRVIGDPLFVVTASKR